MSYEQKYLKYKQKSQELKKTIANINNLEVEASTDVQEFILSDTPTFKNQQNGGGILDFFMGSSNNETEMMTLSDTPTDDQPVGSYEPATGVDEYPNVQTAGSDELVGGNDELTSTTDIDKIQNTEDIERLFNQLGGKKRHSRRSSKHQSDLENLDNLDSSESSATTSSDSLTDISSDDI